MSNVTPFELPVGATEAREPAISVVVATYNRRESLAKLLDSLARQTLSRVEYEVIVVSDGATDGTVDMLHGYQGRVPGLQVLETQNRGPGAARNAGARQARGRYLAFTDDDCIAERDWLEQIVQAFERTGAVAIQGRTTTNRSAKSPLTHQVEILSSRTTSMPTCNAAYLKSVFDGAGGFDEAFRYAHNEDADLAWRVEEYGKIVFVPEVHIIHPPRKDRFSKRARWVRGLESEFLLFHKNQCKYRRYVSPSPWWTIYFHVFVRGQVRATLSYCKYLVKPFRPSYFVIGMSLVAARGVNLVRFLPDFAKAQAFYRSKFQLRPESSSNGVPDLRC